ncbi:ABC transporter substrate-binding protein [Limimaricola soesokkakensis]|uniref:ABC transporter substrate-binding protein n=1 Tax=Limimaricola soesokkakensis TaxID=1343159 RepID=UPI00351752B0
MKRSSLIMSALLAATAATATAQGAHPQGGTLTVPIITATFVEDFNPFSNAQEDLVRGTMFEPLWTHNVMKGEIDYRLAESFAYADDLMSMTITLRDDLTWSDGEVLDAEDVAYSLALGQEDATLDKTGKWADGLLASVEAVDPTTVRVTFNRPDSTFDWYVEQAYIVPEHIWRDVEDKITFKNADPVGSGPITQVTTMRDNQVEICRNPHYYKADDGLPFLDCIKFRQYSDNSQIQPALMAGEIDWGSNFIADIESTFVARDPENHGFWYPANDLVNLYLNTREAPFDDIDFRRAMSMSLDRETIVDLAAYGYPTVATHATGLGEYYAADFDEKVDAEFDQYVAYDPDAAIALLDEAGYVDVDGDGFRETPDGAPIDFGIQVVNGWTDWVQSAQMVAEYLAEVGIKATTETVDWSVYDTALKEGTYEASMNWSTAGVDPIQAYNDYFHPDRVGQSWHTNHGKASEEMGALIDEYGETTDTARRDEILAELMTYTGETMPFIPLFSNPTWYQYNSSRIGGWPSAENPTVQPVFYSSGRKLIVFEDLYQK